MMCGRVQDVSCGVPFQCVYSRGFHVLFTAFRVFFKQHLILKRGSRRHGSTVDVVRSTALSPAWRTA